MNKGITAMKQSNLANTKERLLLVCVKPYRTYKGKQQKRKEIEVLRNYVLKIVNFMTTCV